MKKIYLVVLATLGLFSLPVTAVTISDLQYQTSQGETFTHSLNGPASNGSNGILTAHIRGDLHDSILSESIANISIDGNILGSNILWNGPNTYGQVQNSFDDREFYIDFVISAGLLSTIMADHLAIVTVEFSSGMNPFNPNFFSEVSLSYDTLSPVPLPAAAWLFGTALLCFASWKRKTLKKNA